MKLTTKAKVLVASIKALSPEEIKEVVVSTVKDTKDSAQKSGDEFTYIIKSLLGLRQNAYAGLVETLNQCSEEEIQEVQERLGRIIETTAACIDSNADDVVSLFAFGVSLYERWKKETVTILEQDKDMAAFKEYVTLARKGTADSSGRHKEPEHTSSDLHMANHQGSPTLQ